MIRHIRSHPLLSVLWLLLASWLLPVLVLLTATSSNSAVGLSKPRSHPVGR